MITKTTKKRHLFTVMKRVGNGWRRIENCIFPLRRSARECCQELNNVNPLKTGGKIVKRYRVAKMEIVAPRGS